MKASSKASLELKTGLGREGRPNVISGRVVEMMVVVYKALAEDVDKEVDKVVDKVVDKEVDKIVDKEVDMVVDKEVDENVDGTKNWRGHEGEGRPKVTL